MKTTYIAPQIDIIEVEIEDAILSFSTTVTGESNFVLEDLHQSTGRF